MESYNKACFQAALEGAVLLENHGSLPFRKGEKVALFGREPFEYQKSGSGSGGDVRSPYVTDIHDELKEKVVLDEEVTNFYADFIKANPFDWNGGWLTPTVQKQPMIEESLVERAAARNDIAMVILERVYGESFDQAEKKGEWYLSDAEEDLFQKLSRHFRHIVVLLNIGNPMDLSFLKRYPAIDSLLIVWQGGMEGGKAAASLLMGEAAPSGKLPITLTKSIHAYEHVPFGSYETNLHEEDIYVGYRYFDTFAPEEVLYPFGFGLSYTKFAISYQNGGWDGDHFKANVLVKNTGSVAGKEVVQLYTEAPQGDLEEPKRVLVGFQKTKLLAPGESETLTLSLPLRVFARFDDRDDSKFAHSFVLEKGTYRLCLGGDVREAKECDSFLIPETKLIERLSAAARPEAEFDVLSQHGKRHIGVGPRVKLPEMPAIPYTGDKGYTFQDVRNGAHSLKEFIGQFNVEELAPMTIGEGWNSPKASVPNSAAVYGGNLEPLTSKGVEIVTCCDGPSGLRAKDERTHIAIPVGVCLAATFNPSLADALADTVYEDLKEAKVYCLLGPGINIMRHPFGGRNFEYFSEDPLLAGTMASAYVNAYAKHGIAACIKHYAVNSQETERYYENEVLSERALREIFLIPFEMAAKTGNLHAVMTSYNEVNGRHSGSNAELVNVILRQEWGYQGLVMTDWGCRVDTTLPKDEKPIEVDRYSSTLAAGVDIYMVQTDPVKPAQGIIKDVKEGRLDFAVLQQAAYHLLDSVLFLQGPRD